MRWVVRYLWLLCAMAMRSSAFSPSVLLPTTVPTHASMSPFSRRPIVSTALGAAVLERVSEEVTPRPHRCDTPEHWEVRLYNDGLNTREHVSRSLVQVTGLSEYQAYQTMMQAHEKGMAVVGRYFYEIAEMFEDALKREGIICDIVPVGSDL